MWPNTMKWVALRICEKWEKGKTKKNIVFCQNRPIAVAKYDNGTPNML
jgi:hypothetical protein